MKRIGCSMTYAPFAWFPENSIRLRPRTTPIMLTMTVDNPAVRPIKSIRTLTLTPASNNASTNSLSSNMPTLWLTGRAFSSSHGHRSMSKQYCTLYLLWTSHPFFPILYICTVLLKWGRLPHRITPRATAGYR